MRLMKPSHRQEVEMEAQFHTLWVLTEKEMEALLAAAS
jgi:hypothetical protein